MKKIVVALIVLIASMSSAIGGELQYTTGEHTIKENVKISKKTTISGHSTVIVISGNLEISGELTVSDGAILIIEGSVTQNAKVVIDGGYIVDAPHYDKILNYDVWDNSLGYEISLKKGNNGGLLAIMGDYKFSGKKEGISTPGGHVNETTYIYVSSTYHGEEALKRAIEILGEKSNLLPIELTYFTVSQKGTDIAFDWETASETNNDFFTIEYSIDGINFHELTTIAGSGTTSEATSYNYVWNADESGLFYFRLKQTDYNGEFSYSKVVALNFNKETIQGIYFQKGKIMYNGNTLRL